MNINKMKELLDKLDNLSEVYQAFKRNKMINEPLLIGISNSTSATFMISENCYNKVRILMMNDIRKQMNQVRKEIENEIKI